MEFDHIYYGAWLNHLDINIFSINNNFITFYINIIDNFEILNNKIVICDFYLKNKRNKIINNNKFITSKYQIDKYINGKYIDEYFLLIGDGYFLKSYNSDSEYFNHKYEKFTTDEYVIKRILE